MRTATLLILLCSSLLLTTNGCGLTDKDAQRLRKDMRLCDRDRDEYLESLRECTSARGKLTIENDELREKYEIGPRQDSDTEADLDVDSAADAAAEPAEDASVDDDPRARHRVSP